MRSVATRVFDSLSLFLGSTLVEQKVSGDLQIIQQCPPFTLPAHVSIYCNHLGDHNVILIRIEYLKILIFENLLQLPNLPNESSRSACYSPAQCFVMKLDREFYDRRFEVPLILSTGIGTSAHMLLRVSIYYHDSNLNFYQNILDHQSYILVLQVQRNVKT